MKSILLGAPSDYVSEHVIRIIKNICDLYREKENKSDAGITINVLDHRSVTVGKIRDYCLNSNNRLSLNIMSDKDFISELSPNVIENSLDRGIRKAKIFYVNFDSINILDEFYLHDLVRKITKISNSNTRLLCLSTTRILNKNFIKDFDEVIIMKDTSYPSIKPIIDAIRDILSNTNSNTDSNTDSNTEYARALARLPGVISILKDTDYINLNKINRNIDKNTISLNSVQDFVKSLNEVEISAQK